MSIREDFERRCILENSILTNHHRSAEISQRGCRCGAGCESVLECEFWYMQDSVGWAASVKAFLLRWNVAPIVIRTRDGSIPQSEPRAELIDLDLDDCVPLAESMQQVIEQVKAENEARRRFLGK